MKYYDIERLKDFNRVYTFMLRKRNTFVLEGGFKQ